jgi:hypothetical protein
MALDSTAQVAAISRFLGGEGYSPDFISPGSTPYFHYTDYNAFASIVMKRDLWLTDAGFSNDAEELEHGRLFIDKTLREQAEDGITREVRQLAQDVAELEAKAKDRKDPPEAAYVCCFCESGDLLSQWRGYAAHGGGVAIEIDQSAFGNLAGVDNPIGIMRFWKVFYKDDLKQRRVLRLLSFWATQPEPPSAPQPKLCRRRLAAYHLPTSRPLPIAKGSTFHLWTTASALRPSPPACSTSRATRRPNITAV